MESVQSYLPLFSGFYNTIWDCDSLEDSEIFNINQERKLNGKDEIEYDKIQFDFKEYKTQVSYYLIEKIKTYLSENNFINDIIFEEIISPKFYNYSNDSINVTYKLSKDNINNINRFLIENIEDFKDYININYSSYDGFISFHSNDAVEWIIDNDLLTDKHKLGSVLGFICEHEFNEDDLYMDSDNTIYISVKNYNECML